MPDVPVYSYDNKAIKEDLLSIITNVTPRETQLLYGLKQSVAKQPIHQWTNDTLAAVGASAAAEGADITITSRTSPTRDVNYTQIFVVPVMVTGSDQMAESVAGDRMAYELDKAMKEYANNCEFALMRGTLVCGSGTTARSMKGVMAFASTLKTSQSGVTLTESKLIDHLDAHWAQGTNGSEVYVGKTLKKRINSFTSNSTLYIDAKDKRLTNTIDVLETTNGVTKIFRHRYVTVAGDTNNDLVTIDPEHVAIANFRNPKIVDLAKTGDGEKKAIIGESTLEVRSEKAVGLIQKLV